MPKDSLSKRIRDLTRLLALDSLPETTRQEKERALASLRAEKTTSKRTHEINSMTQKYKMVKFVEHQKAVRKLQKAKKALERADAENHKALLEARDQVRKRKIDVLYIENYPLLEKYISLYKDVEGSERVKQRRDEIWSLAEQGKLTKGTLSLDDQAQKHPKGEKGHVKPTTDVVEQQEEEVDDFFE